MIPNFWVYIAPVVSEADVTTVTDTVLKHSFEASNQMARIDNDSGFSDAVHICAHQTKMQHSSSSSRFTAGRGRIPSHSWPAMPWEGGNSASSKPASNDAAATGDAPRDTEHAHKHLYEPLFRIVTGHSTAYISKGKLYFFGLCVAALISSKVVVTR